MLETSKKLKSYKELKKWKKSLHKSSIQCELAARLERNEPVNKVPLEKKMAFPLNMEGKGRYFLSSFKVDRMDGYLCNRCSLKIELCNSRNPQTLFLLEDGV